MITVTQKGNVFRLVKQGEDGKWRIHHPKSGNVEHLEAGEFLAGVDAFDTLCRAYPNRELRWEASVE